MSDVHYDLSGLYLNISLVPNGTKLWDFFPQLAAYEEFVNVVNDNEIRIAILLSDIKSPFIKIPDNRLRIKALFEFLEIGLKTPKNQEFFNEVMSYQHKRVIPAACRYIQMMNHHDFASWWSLNIAFYDLHRESVKPREEKQTALDYAKGKAMISREMDAISVKLKDYEARLFSNLNLKQQMVEQELKKIAFFPEKHAEKFQGFNNEEFS